MKRYERYKDSGVEWLGEVPEHWGVVKGKYIWKEHINLSNDGIGNLLSVSQYDGVTPNNQEQRTDSLIGYKIIEHNDLVINIMLAWLGGLGLSSFRGLVSPAYSVFKPLFNINERFFHYLYRTSLYLDEFARKSTGVVPSRWRMYGDDFGQVWNIFPPIQEQNRIVAFLDERCAKIDKAIEQKVQMIELLNERRQIIIQRAVTRGLNPNVPLKDSDIDWIGRIPSHWQIKKLKYVFEEKNIKQISTESQFNYIGMENIESWTGKYIETNSEVEGLANVFNENNVLFGKLRPYLAKVYIAKEKGLCSTEFIVYDIHDNNSTYIQKLLSSTSFINTVNASTYGSKMPRANSPFIGNLKIPIPPLSEQREIADFLNKVSPKIEQAIKLKHQEIERLKEYKQTLINSAVTGKIKIE